MGQSGMLANRLNRPALADLIKADLLSDRRLASPYPFIRRSKPFDLIVHQRDGPSILKPHEGSVTLGVRHQRRPMDQVRRNISTVCSESQ